VARAFGWFCARFKHVVFVPGNHEYYKTSPSDGDAVLTACAGAGLRKIALKRGRWYAGDTAEDRRVRFA